VSLFDISLFGVGLSPFCDQQIAEAYQRLKNSEPLDGLPPFATEAAYMLLEQEERRAKRATPDAKRKFRSSLAWRRTRYKVLAMNSKAHGGQVTCELCKSTTGPFHVDHVLPVSTEEGWQRRFDVSVLRCTCEACNTGRLASPISMERPTEAMG
jgi:hypothetical protein